MAPTCATLAMHLVWLRSPISIYQESEDDIELLPLYHVHVSHTVLCHRLVKLHSRNDKKKKDGQMSVYQKADIGELIQ